MDHRPDQLRKLEPFVDDPVFRKRFRAAKRQNKELLAQLIARETGITVSPDSLFDVQVKRLHEYKRQLLLVLYIIVLYDRLKKTRPWTLFLARSFLAPRRRRAISWPS